MASQVERSSNGAQEDSTRLPSITEGSSLVSPPKKFRPPSIKDQAKLWAADALQG